MNWIAFIAILLAAIGGYVVRLIFGKGKEGPDLSEPMGFSKRYDTLKRISEEKLKTNLKEVDNASKDTLRTIISTNLKRLLNREPK